ncbi:D-alanyl-D-alanine carboxypeptidase family protein [Caldichromatium japonicum]|uniref:D-alanyl-D-alanine carboxypeptidase family protein n=1 Tax=Caldichromatium japonicum TaxID=2699430 RepID=UPI001FE639C2|nr:serine hydrolase [Caldichromatium japonicum]
MSRPDRPFAYPSAAVPKPYVNASAPALDAADLWSPFGTPRRAWSLREHSSEWAHLNRAALNVQSASAMIVDERGNVLYAKNPRVVRPIASVTKLMTAMVVLDTGISLETPIRITADDLDRLKNSRSRLRINDTVLTRREMIMAALISSDNRAAHALGRTTFRGGTVEFVQAMNRKARALGMVNTQFVDASGLDPRNRSTAEDLVKLVRAAANYPLIREATSRAEMILHPFGDGTALQYRNTNPLVRSPEWRVEVSKTGFLNEAGRCLVMQARIADRRFYMVFLGGSGHLTPMGDSNRVREWILASNRLTAAR